VLRVAIIDDETPARRYLRRLLETQADVQIVGEAANLTQARTLIEQESPHGLFLDIELTQGTGFDLLRGLDPHVGVIFVTAHANHAPRAFDVEALDYLLKPVGAPRLEQALARLRRMADARPAPAYLVIRGRQATRPIRLQDLSVVLAQGDYVQLCCADGSSELMLATMSGLLPQLPMPPFFQASRSLIINLDHVVRVSSGDHRQVEFIQGRPPFQLGLTAFQRLKQALAARAGNTARA